MKFKVYEELSNLLKEGAGTFEVTEAEDTVSKKNSYIMIKLKLRISDDLGKSISIFAYLVAIESAAFKVREFCAATGLDYKKGELDVNLIMGKRGKCTLFTEKGTGGHPDRTAIKNYIAIENPTEAITEAFKDDEVPF